MRFKGIFMKLFAAYLLILFLSFCLFGAASYLLLQRDFMKRHQDVLLSQQNAVVDYIEKAYEKGWDLDTLISSLELSVAQQDKVFYLYDLFGQLLYQVGQTDQPLQPDPDLIQSALNGERQIRPMSLNNHRVFVAVAPLTGPSDMREKVVVMVSYSFDRDFNRTQSLLLLGILFTVGITALCVFYFSKKITDPLRQMNRIALEFAKGKFEHRVQIKTKDEIGQLGNSLNYMAQELAGLDQMRKDFVANVSHDLRSPLTSIQGFLTALLDGTVPPERQKHYLSIMKDGTERMIKLVEDLLDLARIEAGQIQVTPVPFHLTEMLRQTIARMEPLFLPKQLQVRLLTDDKQEIRVFADPHRIDQVMVNLLQNAIQFSPNGSAVDVILSKQSDRAVIAVRDYGPGITEEEKALIWQRFYKVDKARSQKVGAGIGLSIVYHILDLHGTSIEVESTPGKGTVFTFTLPAL